MQVKYGLGWICNEDKITMQFIADIVKKMVDKKYLKVEDLYVLEEKDVIAKIENCEDKSISKAFSLFRNTTTIGEGDNPISDKYCVSVKSKRRYVNPLVNIAEKSIRTDKASEVAKECIEKYLNYTTKKYAYFDFKM